MSIDNQEHQLTYNATYKMIFGLTRWYKNHDSKVGDEIILEKIDDKYRISFKGIAGKPLVEEAESIIDISGLSFQAKGNVVEKRIKELIVLHGQGLLSVFSPVTDTQGIDLIVTKSGMES